MVSRVEDRKTDNDLAIKRSEVVDCPFLSKYCGAICIYIHVFWVRPSVKIVQREILTPFLLLILTSQLVSPCY